MCHSKNYVPLHVYALFIFSHEIQSTHLNQPAAFFWKNTLVSVNEFLVSYAREVFPSRQRQRIAEQLEATGA